MNIRKAKETDIPRINELLGQVLEIHAAIRPDIFIKGTTKYTPEQLCVIINDENTPIFVSTDENDEISGYCFCVIKRQLFSTNMVDHKTLFIDDLCVDKNARGKSVGTALYNYAVDYAKSIGCYDLTLNVWEGNVSARHFYEKMGMKVKETQMEFIL